MPVLVHAPGQAYLIGAQRFDSGSPAFGHAVAAAYVDHRRLHCSCRRNGIEMYIAKVAATPATFVVKRMPESGHLHAADCPSFEPPAELSGLGQVLGSAIVEDRASGTTTLKLDFALSKTPGRSMSPSAREHGSVQAAGVRLSLRGLLHYLWDQAGLTRWHAGFAGRRSWAVVRRHLLAAADDKFARGDPLCACLYLPESFVIDQREVLQARRLAHWSRTLPQAGRPTARSVLIGEVKAVLPSRFGHKVVIKHIPEQAFVLETSLYRRMRARFEGELALWGANETLHMIVIATFGLSQARIPTIDELSLMLVTDTWIPVSDGLDIQLTLKLTCESRSFFKPLRYNLGSDDSLPAAYLLDTDSAPTPLRVRTAEFASQGDEQSGRELPLNNSTDWCWQADRGQIPAFPASGGNRVRSSNPQPRTGQLNAARMLATQRRERARPAPPVDRRWP